MKYILFILTLLFLPVMTQAASGVIINFVYSDNQLSFGNPAIVQDKDMFVSIISFQEQSERSSGRFALRMIDTYDNTLVTKRFEPQPGGFSLTVPYYPTIKAMQVFENNAQSPILEYDLRAINTCNANHVCEYERGETGANCIIDCGVSNPDYSKETQRILDENNGIITNTNGVAVIREREGGNVFSWWAIALGVAVAGATIFLIKRRNRV